MKLYTAGKKQQFFLIIQINNQYIHVIIDLGAMGNFINKQQTNSYGFLFRKKTKPYTLYTLDRSTINSNKEQMTFETKILTIKILKKHIEDIQFDITIIRTHIVILGAL